MKYLELWFLWYNRLHPRHFWKRGIILDQDTACESQSWLTSLPLKRWYLPWSYILSLVALLQNWFIVYIRRDPGDTKNWVPHDYSMYCVILLWLFPKKFGLHVAHIILNQDTPCTKSELRIGPLCTTSFLTNGSNLAAWEPLVKKDLVQRGPILYSDLCMGCLDRG